MWNEIYGRRVTKYWSLFKQKVILRIPELWQPIRVMYRIHHVITSYFEKCDTCIWKIGAQFNKKKFFSGSKIWFHLITFKHKRFIFGHVIHKNFYWMNSTFCINKTYHTWYLNNGKTWEKSQICLSIMI